MEQADKGSDAVSDIRIAWVLRGCMDRMAVDLQACASHPADYCGRVAGAQARALMSEQMAAAHFRAVRAFRGES